MLHLSGCSVTLHVVLSIAVTALGFGGEIGLLIVLLARRQYRAFPIFTCYFAYNFVSDLVIGGSVALYSAQAGKIVQLASLPLQFLLELCVLAEIAWIVLKPLQATLPRATGRVFAGIVSIALLSGVLLAWQIHNTGTRIEDITRPLDLTVGFLRMLMFAATAGFAQVLGIGWKDKVLRLATTLSLYSVLDLMISLGERLWPGSPLEPYRSVAYLLELSMLVWVFTTKEVRRREFSPQMEQFLVTLAGRAKHARTAIVRMQVK